jgi:hypothetical protein
MCPIRLPIYLINAFIMRNATSADHDQTSAIQLVNIVKCSLRWLIRVFAPRPRQAKVENYQVKMAGLGAKFNK